MLGLHFKLRRGCQRHFESAFYCGHDKRNRRASAFADVGYFKPFKLFLFFPKGEHIAQPLHGNVIFIGGVYYRNGRNRAEFVQIALLYSARDYRAHAVARNDVYYVLYVFAGAHVVFDIRQVNAHAAKLSDAYFQRGARPYGGVAE